MTLLPGTGRNRKTFLQVSAAACLLIAASLAEPACRAQAAQPTLQQFVGTWQAKFSGKVFQTITLEMHDGQLTGISSGIHIELGKGGELADAEATGTSDPIAEAKLTGRTLLLSIKEKNSDDAIQFEMILNGANEAEIRLVAPAEAGSPKPWKSERIAK
jgi:hypothetical protein